MVKKTYKGEQVIKILPLRQEEAELQCVAQTEHATSSGREAK